VALVGCGGDSETVADPRTDPPESLSTGTDHEPTVGTPEEHQPSRDPTLTTPEQSPPPEGGSPEDQPGGAGDEEPIGVDAIFTGRGGKVTPRVVRVPPFIAVTVTLVSADGEAYALEIAGQRLVAGPGGRRDSITLDGLRQGGSYPGTVQGGGSVEIEASAEPGP
jgi:hypothetical protein